MWVILEKELDGRSSSLLLKTNRSLSNECLKLSMTLGWNLKANECVSDVRTMVTVVENADVPPVFQGFQEGGKGTRLLGELSFKNALIRRRVASAPDHVSDVGLSNFIAR